MLGSEKQNEVAIFKLASDINEYLAEGVKYNLTDLPEIGSEGHRDIWQERVREVSSII